MGVAAAGGGVVGRLQLGRRWCEPVLRLVVRPSRVVVVAGWLRAADDGDRARGES